MAAIHNDWLDALKGEFKKPYYRKLFETVNEEYRTHLGNPSSRCTSFNAPHISTSIFAYSARCGSSSGSSSSIRTIRSIIL